MYIYNITTTITTILNQEKKSINAYRSFIMKPYKGKKLFDFPSERQNQNRRAGRFFSPRLFNGEPNFKKFNNANLAAKNMRTVQQYQRPISISSDSSRSRSSRSTNVSHLISPRTKKISKQNIHVNFTANLPSVLQNILNEWDTGNRNTRKQILENFLHQYSRQTSATIEADFGNGGSLLLSRFSSFLKMSYRSGFELALQLNVLSTFVVASSGSTYLSELLETGVIMTSLELFSLDRKLVKKEDIVAGLQMLRRVAATGRVYKEILCENDAVLKIVDCLNEQADSSICEFSRALLVELGTGNPRHAHVVLRGLLRLLPCKNSHARRIGAQAARMLLSSYSPHQYIGNDGSRGRKTRDNTLLAFVPVAIDMLRSIDLQVQYEAIEMLKTLVREGKLGASIVVGLLPLLETIEIIGEREESVKGDGKGNYKENDNDFNFTDEAVVMENNEKNSFRFEVAIKKNFENIEEANAYNRKCRACYGWQTSASKALLELCKAFENIIDCLVRCDAFVYLLTTLLNVRNYHGQQVAHEILIMIVDYVPEILDKIRDDYSGGNNKLWNFINNFSQLSDTEKNYVMFMSDNNNDSSKNGNDRVEHKNFIENKLKIRKLIDTSDEFLSSDAEYMFIENQIMEEENEEAAAIARSKLDQKYNNINRAEDHSALKPMNEDVVVDDGSDYRELMNAVIERSNAQ